MIAAQTDAPTEWVELRPVAPARAQIGEGIGADIGKKFKVPLIIHQTHIAYKLPRPLARCVQSWIDLNPEFEHRYYDDAAMDAYVRAHGAPDYVRAFDYIANLHPRASGAIKADLFRLLLLSREGGVWADADRWALKPIMSILRPSDQFICGSRYNSVSVSFEVIIAAPRHPFITRALDNIIKSNLHEKRFASVAGAHLYTGAIPFSKSARALTPVPHPQKSGAYPVIGYPDFTYTMLGGEAIDQWQNHREFLSMHMWPEQLDAIKKMGRVHYFDASLTRAWRYILPYLARDPKGFFKKVGGKLTAALRRRARSI